MATPRVETVLAWQRKQRANGKCATCINDSPDSRICSACRKVKTDSTKAKKLFRQSNGKCRECNSFVFGNKKLCMTHFLKETSRGRLGSSVHWQDLKSIFQDQNGLCALTGDILTAENMELDHIHSTSTGGVDSPANVRWVTRDANRAKQSLSDSELLTLCQKIIKTLT